jgi:glycosidase
LHDEAANNMQSPSYQLFKGLKNLIHLRKKTKSLAGGNLQTIATNNASVIAYIREYGGENVCVITNFSDKPQHINLESTTLLQGDLLDLITNQTTSIHQDLLLQPYQFLWLK